MPKVVLAGKYPINTFETLKAMLNDDIELVKVDDENEYNNMKDAEIIILRIFKAPKEIIEKNKKLKMIMRWGAGFDSVDVDYASKKGIIVTNTPGANSKAVAELAVMLMLVVGRKLMLHQESLKKGQWSKNFYINSSFSLNEKIVGIIGGGNIGRQVSKCVQAFGARTQYYDKYRLDEKLEKQCNLEFKNIEELLKTSDIITLHVPLNDENFHMIGKKEVSLMKDNTIIINTSRGGLVDDRALLEAVKAGKLLGVGLDVVEDEPLKADDELILNPNIVVTPHIGGGTADIGTVIIPMLVDDIYNYINERDIKYSVNKEMINLE